MNVERLQRRPLSRTSLRLTLSADHSLQPSPVAKFSLFYLKLIISRLINIEIFIVDGHLKKRVSIFNMLISTYLRVSAASCILAIISLTCFSEVRAVTIPTNEVVRAYKTASLYSAVEPSKDYPAEPSNNPSLDKAVGKHIERMKELEGAKAMGRTQKKFEYATRILHNRYDLSPEQVQSLSDVDLKTIIKDGSIEQCESQYHLNCDFSSPYRTYDGSCNNRDNPTWGMAPSCFGRLHKPFYADGISSLRTSQSGKPLPQVRKICRKIHNDVHNPLNTVSGMYIEWGQFVSHDISLTALSTADGKPLNCCPRNGNNAPPQCDAVHVDRDDNFYSAYQIDCLNNPRAVACATCRLGPRQQINQQTAFLDGSLNYGSSYKSSLSKRKLDGSGKLNISDDSKSSSGKDPTRNQCSFITSDSKHFREEHPKVHKNSGLDTLQTLFQREHNRIAEQLKCMNSWDEDRTFEETRRIVAAEFQAITFNEFVPLTVGQQLTLDNDLGLSLAGYTNYDPNGFSGLYTEFSGAAYRYGHSVFQNIVLYVSPNGSDIRPYIEDSFTHPEPVPNGDMDSRIRGLLRIPVEDSDRYMVDSLTNHLLQVAYPGVGLDLCSINVKRGRDLGLPPYVEMVRLCSGTEINTFDDLYDIFRPGYVELYKERYESVYDIDFFSGGLGEEPKDGAIVGPTFSYVIAKQFSHLKFNDRFYFEHGDQAGSFTPEQLNQLRSASLAKIICANSDVEQTQERVLEAAGAGNPYKNCDEIASIDLSSWKE